MKSSIKIISILVLVFAGSCSNEMTSEFNAGNLRCEYMNEALVVKAVPRFSWEIASKLQGQDQTAWQIIVSDDISKINRAKGNILNSRKKSGNETYNIKLNNLRLQSFKKYYWKVRIWDQDGKVSDWSKAASFITGSLGEDEWKAEWIGDHPEAPVEYPLLYKHIGYLSSFSNDKSEEKWIQIDLGKTEDIDKIILYPSFNNIKNIKDYYFPRAYRIEISTDGDNWEKSIERDPASDPGGKPVELIIKKTQGRYIRIVATSLRSYNDRVFDYEDQGDPSKLFAFSLAEMEVINNDKIVSSACKVSYKDALIKIDREDGYDPDMLTDGITDTPPYPETRLIPPSPLLRKKIVLSEKPAKALAYVSSLGVYELSLNGHMAGQSVLGPEWTDYNKRVQYQVFDVTDLLESGDNVIGAQLADGWYAGMLGPTRWSPYYPKRGAYGINRRLFFQMELTYPNGEKETIISDDSWKIYKDGPVRMADNFLGETYDANKEEEGWQEKNFDDSAWNNVVTDKQDDINLVPQINQPIKIIETLEAKSVTKTKNGRLLFDVGENITGWCNIKIDGKSGDKIILRHGEILDNNGELYTENLGAAIQTDSVILGASGKITYEPRFTFHGFRFVEVEGLRGKPDKSILKARVIASDQPQTGHFECSNPMLNQLYKNINRSHISNMTGIPTDCPQRDERCGWMGDVFIFAQTSMFNRDMSAFYNKWMIDIMDAQSERGTFPDIAPHPFAYEKHFTNAPGWADAAVKLPYLMYLNYGDKEIIEEHFEAYERYIENIRSSNPDLIWRSGLGLNYGDWLNGNTLNAKGFPKTGAQIPSEVFSTIMFYNSVNIVSKMASAIGNEDKTKYYSELASKIKNSFVTNFVNDEGKIEGDAQACYAMALHYGLYQPELEKIFEKRMIDKFIPYSGRMNTGFHSTLCLMKELIKRGYITKAYELLETKEFPSWGYSIEQGATSIWERWDGFVKGRGFQGAGMNSFNHYAFGAIGEWMYENILGIQPDPELPGYKHFILKPVPGGSLSWAKGSYRSIRGLIEASWELDNKHFNYNLNIPPNTTAKVSVPGKNINLILGEGENISDITEIVDVKYVEGYSIFEVGSGTYSVTSELN